MMEGYLKEIKNVLNKFENIDYAFIFGSYIRNPLSESDVDILVGGSLSYSKKLDLALELELILGRKVDLILVEEALPELILNAFCSGVPVLINNKEKLKSDYFKNFYLYEDREGIRRLRILRIKRRYSYGG
jgi:predicted nucleotidyltransferase